jgi:hypothetical protein
MGLQICERCVYNFIQATLLAGIFFARCTHKLLRLITMFSTAL